VEGQPRTAEHEWVIPQPERESIYITQIARVRAEHLAGHPHDFVALHKDELRRVIEMGFDKPAIPGWPPRSHRQRRICRGSCPEEGVVPPVYKYRAEVEFFYVEESCQSGTIKGLVPQPFAQNRTAEGRVKVRWSLSEKGKCANTLDAKLP